MHTLSELVSKVKTGELLEGAVIGVCGPNCGDIVVKRAGPSAHNPNRMYGACQAPSGHTHKSFLWVEGEETPNETLTGKRLFVDHVPHTLEKGARWVWASHKLHHCSSFPEADSYLLTVSKRTKVIHQSEQLVRLQIEALGVSPAGVTASTGLLVTDTLGKYTEVSCYPSSVGPVMHTIPLDDGEHYDSRGVFAWGEGPRFHRRRFQADRICPQARLRRRRDLRNGARQPHKSQHNCGPTVFV
jgi:hypothetical protein